MKKMILYTGAVINFLFVILHILFWPMFNWKEDLAKLSPENAAIVPVLNIALIAVFLYCSVMSIIISRMETFDIAARSILILVSIIYFIRFILGYPFFGISTVEVIVWIICLSVVIPYMYLFFKGNRDTDKEYTR
jgi:O-antigen ligase